MMDLITLIIVFCVGFFVGRRHLIKGMIKHLEQIAKDESISLEVDESADEHAFPLCITELDGNQLYLYDKKTKAFYCQAQTLEELALSLNQQRKIDVAFVQHNDERFWFVNGKIESAVLSES